MITSDAKNFHTQSKKQNGKCYSFGVSWVRNNIFNDTLDASLYLIFYIVLPIAMGLISLYISKGKPLERIYCYIGILINAFGCGYDLINRRDKKENSVKNTKLWIMGASVIIIILSCIIGIILVTSKLSTEISDNLFLAYFLAIFVALTDILPLLISHSNFRMPIPDDVL